jgi:hypothetical protein
MGFWRYEHELCRRATADAWRFCAGRVVWGLLVLAGGTTIVLYWTGDIAVAAVAGLGGIAFAAIVIWLWNLVRAPYLRDREQQEEIEKLRARLNPDLRAETLGGASSV